jgi:hypothetical protein
MHLRLLHLLKQQRQMQEQQQLQTQLRQQMQKHWRLTRLALLVLIMQSWHWRCWWVSCGQQLHSAAVRPVLALTHQQLHALRWTVLTPQLHL